MGSESADVSTSRGMRFRSKLDKRRNSRAMFMEKTTRPDESGSTTTEAVLGVRRVPKVVECLGEGGRSLPTSVLRVRGIAPFSSQTSFTDAVSSGYRLLVLKLLMICPPSSCHNLFQEYRMQCFGTEGLVLRKCAALPAPSLVHGGSSIAPRHSLGPDRKKAKY